MGSEIVRIVADVSLNCRIRLANNPYFFTSVQMAKHCRTSDLPDGAVRAELRKEVSYFVCSVSLNYSYVVVAMGICSHCCAEGIHAGDRGFEVSVLGVVARSNVDLDLVKNNRLMGGTMCDTG